MSSLRHGLVFCLAMWWAGLAFAISHSDVVAPTNGSETRGFQVAGSHPQFSGVGIDGAKASRQPAHLVSGAPGLRGLAHYIVFELGPQGEIRPASYDLVEMQALPTTKSKEVITALIGRSDGDVDLVDVALIGSDGMAAFRDVVEVPRWLRGEFAGQKNDPSIKGTRSELTLRPFVVRVPSWGPTDLRLRALRFGTKFAFDLHRLASEPALASSSRLANSSVLTPAQTGDPGNRVDILIMGDGYTAAEESKFNSDADGLASGTFSVSPYALYGNYLNTYKYFIASEESGADHWPYSISPCQAYECCHDPQAQSDPRQGQLRATAFDAVFCADHWTHRLLGVNFTKVLSAAAAMPDWDLIMMTVNDDTYGGSGGLFCTSSTHPLAVNIMQHELGHAFSDLADEYEYSLSGVHPGCNVGAGCPPNITDQVALGMIPWSPWISAQTPIPTPENDDWGGIVGLFEGADHYQLGIYRPALQCGMRNLGWDFCPICKQTFVLRLYQGGWGIPAGGIDNIEPGSESPEGDIVHAGFPGTVVFSVDLLAPIGGPPLDVSWWVNGQMVVGATGSSFIYQTTGFGEALVEVRTKDQTALVNTLMAGGALSHSRSWTVHITPPLVILSAARSGSGGGRVNSSPVGINCGDVCEATFEGDSVVNLVEVPAAGSKFAGWSGSCTGSGLCTITMDAAKSVTASFCQLPGRFDPTFPPHNGIVPTGTVTLRWTPSAGATIYDLYIDAQPVQSTTFNYRAISVPSGVVRTWRVVARNTCGTTVAPVTGVRSFATTGPAIVPRDLGIIGTNQQRLPAILVPGQAAVLAPSWRNLKSSAVTTTGTATSFTGPAGATYNLNDNAAAYGSIASGATQSCQGTGNCYQVQLSNPTTRPATHWDAILNETVTANGVIGSKIWAVHVGRSFTDVPETHWAHRFVETMLHNGITSGCGGGSYCPDSSLNRAEMAVMIEMAKHGSGWAPPLSGGGVFTDVPIDHWAGDFIEQLAAEGITSGCGGGAYCPDNPMTRAEMAVFLLAAEHGSGWTPPLSTGTVFTDVPIDHWAGDWIEALAAEGITSGCGGGNYCPDSAVPRAEMAVFLTVTFNLQL